MKNIKVGEILEIKKHANADKLIVLSIQVENEILPVVTNYNDVKIGDKVIIALIGAQLKSDKGDWEVAAVKLRGVESQGMLCDEFALGLPKTLERILFESDLEILNIKL